MLDAIEAKNRPWYDKTWLVVVLCIVFFPAGVYALWKNTKIRMGWKIADSVLIAVVVISYFIPDSSSATPTYSATAVADYEISTVAPAEVGVRDVLRTRHFDITVNRVGLQDSIDTGNRFTSLASERGVVYVVIDTTFKNTDTESHTLLTPGSLLINYNGKVYEYDKSEVILGEGWGLFLDVINPLMEKTTNLVYKIPKEVNGRAYWRPGLAAADEKIFLGNLK